MVDQELKSVAALALRNAFYEEFSGLVNAYMRASEGLIDEQEVMLSDMASVFGRLRNCQGESYPDIWSCDSKNPTWTSVGHETMLEAFGRTEADRIGLQGRIVFTRENGEWYFLD